MTNSHIRDLSQEAYFPLSPPSVLKRNGRIVGVNFEEEIVYSDSETAAFVFGIPHHAVLQACKTLETSTEFFSDFCPIDDASGGDLYEFTRRGLIALIDTLAVPMGSFAVWHYLNEFTHSAKDLAEFIELTHKLEQLNSLMMFGIVDISRQFEQLKREQEHDRRSQSSFVYLMECLSTGLFKIGRTTVLESRLKQIQSMSAGRLRIVQYARGGSELESRLHRDFSGKRQHGEWFSFDDLDLQRIKLSFTRADAA
ncbi:GIY-YIG nuclease family protein [Aeromonas enteropelogenes]|uniref:GIY-YIG nuclease family protein n=1 Tax=Aeromonas enteropelogenes TaxID=29489 RepID=UPI0031360574